MRGAGSTGTGWDAEGPSEHEEKLVFCESDGAEQAAQRGYGVSFSGDA